MSTFCSPGRSLRRVSLLVLLVTLAACASSTVRRQPIPTLASTSTPAPTVASGPFPAPLTGLLGPAPTQCPAGPPLDTLSFAGGGFSGNAVFVGRSPIWNLGINSGENQQLVVIPTGYPSTKVMWIVGPNYHQPVTLSGHELSTGAPVWFDLSSPGGSSPGDPMTRAVLDPAAPNRGATTNASGRWNIWGILLYFFRAGCYQIDAVWASGSWQIVVAVGS